MAPSTGPGAGAPVLGEPKEGEAHPCSGEPKECGAHPCSSGVPVLARVVARIRNLRSAVDEKLCVGARKATASTGHLFSTIINTAHVVASPVAFLSQIFGSSFVQRGAQFLRYKAWHLRIVLSRSGSSTCVIRLSLTLSKVRGLESIVTCFFQLLLSITSSTGKAWLNDPAVCCLQCWRGNCLDI